MGENTIRTDDFSNEESQQLFEHQWQDEPECLEQYEGGKQCGSCSFFAPLNSDFGLCLNSESRHRLETLLEHFTCPSHVEEGWVSHSFGKKNLIASVEDGQI